ncbi:probable polygalacturonase At3g15720 [Olea europaea subsp. europaea]|uniref:Probable polygalacturonase At3g15720 n=1 Tax=Olea europaea subsp. europaea TaxID=158383 RepID=A0A8S0T9N6_OLEEU|nr:probable polygalacturonase At3g15720 [Olea europaea subsp. europaea]
MFILPSHSIGSLGKDGGHDFVENVEVRDVVFLKNLCSARIKTWQDSALQVSKYSEPQESIVRDDIYILSSDNKRNAQVVCKNVHGTVQGSKVPNVFCLDQV